MGKTFRFDPKNPSERKRQMNNANKKKGPDKRNSHDIEDIKGHQDRKDHKHGHYDKQRVWNIPSEKKKGQKV